MLLWGHRLVYRPLTCSNPGVPFPHLLLCSLHQPIPSSCCHYYQTNLYIHHILFSYLLSSGLRGIFGFWLQPAQLCTVTSFFQRYQSHWETLFIPRQCRLAGPVTAVIPGVAVILHQPVCGSSGCSSRGGRSVLQPSSCQHMLTQVVHSHPWGQITHQDVPPPLWCHLSQTPRMHLHSAQASKTLGQIKGGWAPIVAGSLADSKAFDVYFILVSSFSIPSRTQYPTWSDSETWTPPTVITTPSGELRLQQQHPWHRWS